MTEPKSGFRTSELTLAGACVAAVVEVARHPVDSWPRAVVTAAACLALAWIPGVYQRHRNEAKRAPQ